MKPLKFIISMATAYGAAALGSLSTIPNIPNWYAALDKPFFNPPNWVFGPVWSVLYFLIGLSLYLVWTSPSDKPKTAFYITYSVQIALNIVWSTVFFGLHLIEPAAFLIIALLVSIFIQAALAYKIRKPAAFTLIPYAVWVSFASLLNISIAFLN